MEDVPSSSSRAPGAAPPWLIPDGENQALVADARPKGETLALGGDGGRKRRSYAPLLCCPTMRWWAAA